MLLQPQPCSDVPPLRPTGAPLTSHIVNHMAYLLSVDIAGSASSPGVLIKGEILTLYLLLHLQLLAQPLLPEIPQAMHV